MNKRNKTKHNQKIYLGTSWRRLWLFNFREQTSTSALFGGYPLFCPSRHVRTYTATCRSPSLAFSAAIQLTMKCSAPCSSVLRHSPSSWATVVHWSALIPKYLRGHPGRDTPSTLFPALPRSPLAHHLPERDALRQSRVLHARHKYREQYPPPAHNRVDALTYRLHEGVQILNRDVRCRCSLADRSSVSQWHARGLHVTQPYNIVLSTSSLSIRILSSRRALGRSYMYVCMYGHHI